MNLPSILPPHFHFPSPEATFLTSFLDKFSMILCAHIRICRGRIIFQNQSTLNFNPRSQERLAAEEGNVDQFLSLKIYHPTKINFILTALPVQYTESKKKKPFNRK